MLGSCRSLVRLIALAVAANAGIQAAGAEEFLPPAPAAPAPGPAAPEATAPDLAEFDQFPEPLGPPAADDASGFVHTDPHGSGWTCPPTAYAHTHCPPPRRWWQFWKRGGDPCEHGCEEDRCIGPLPLGTSLYATMSAQVANGDAAQMVLHQYDFCAGEPQLSPRGYWELLKILDRAVRAPFPIVIEPAGDADLDAARRAHVLQQLALLDAPVPPERVIVAIPTAGGLDGVDAVPIHQRLLRLSAGGAPGAGVPAAPVPAAAVPPAR